MLDPRLSIRIPPPPPSSMIDISPSSRPTSLPLSNLVIPPHSHVKSASASAASLPQVAMPQTPPMTPPSWTAQDDRHSTSNAFNGMLMRSAGTGADSAEGISPATSTGGDERIVTPRDEGFGGMGDRAEGRGMSPMVHSPGSINGSGEDGLFLPGSSPQIGGLPGSGFVPRKLTDILATGGGGQHVGAQRGSDNDDGDGSKHNVVDLSIDTEDEILFAPGLARSDRHPSYPTFVDDTDDEREQDEADRDLPGSPFRPTRTLSGTGIHMTSSGQNKRSSPPDQHFSYFDKAGLPSPSNAMPGFEGGRGAYRFGASAGAVEVKGKGTYPIPDECTTPSMLESGSVDGGSEPGTPESHYATTTTFGGLPLPSLPRLPFQLTKAANFGLGMGIGLPSSISGSSVSSSNSHKSKQSPAPSPQKKYAEEERRNGSIGAERQANGEKEGSWSGYLGGGGSGVKGKGMKGSGSEHRKSKSVGKFYRPDHPSATDAPQHTTTISVILLSLSNAVARIPRKVRPILVMLVCFVCVGSLVFKWAGQRSLDVERAALRRHASQLQKAFVLNPDATHLPVHPANFLGTADRMANAIARTSSAATTVPVAGTNTAEAPAFVMTRQEELAALISFFTSTTSSALPPIDPALPLDPQLVLDFDYTRATAREDMAQLESDTWSMFPIVLFGNMRDPYHREILKLLSTYKISPPPMVVEIDQRSDAQYLVPLLRRLLQSDDLPQLMLGGRAAGTYKDIIAQSDAGKFMDFLRTSGAGVTEKNVKKKKHGLPKDAERANRERYLAPKPVRDGE